MDALAIMNIDQTFQISSTGKRSATQILCLSHHFQFVMGGMIQEITIFVVRIPMQASLLCMQLFTLRSAARVQASSVADSTAKHQLKDNITITEIVICE